MALTKQDAIGHIEHALGGPLGGSLSPSRIINEAGQVFVNLAPWKFLERPGGYLNLRGTITVVGASWTNATRTLTSASLATYVHLEGDVIEITAGTGATPGFYVVESHSAGSNDIVLKTSIGTTASAVDATLELPSVALPSDFREIIALRSESNVNRSISWTSHEHLLAARVSGALSSSSSFFGAITYGPIAGTAGGPLVARLELWPAPSENDTAGLFLFYRAGWTYVSDDQHFISIPAYCEPLFIQLVRAYAKGLVEEDIASMSARVREIKSGDLFQDALARDQETQRDYGHLRNGALSDGDSGFAWTLSTRVAAPSF